MASSALVKRTADVMRDVAPWARRLVGVAKGGAEATWRAVMGTEVDERIARMEMHSLVDGVDPFGLDVEASKYALGVTGWLYKNYFRCEVHGIENVPKGRVLLISNHSGQIPLDGAMIGSALFFDSEPPRIIRSMVEKWTQTLPFISVLYPRLGQVVGVPENARRLLMNEEALVVFPEGSKGISKPFSRRYQMSEFGLGFMRLALETNTPIVPVAVVGAEEQYINLGNLSGPAKALNMPSFPVVPQWFIPGLQLPLPVKYRIYFGNKMRFTGDADDDDHVIEERVWVVKSTIQSMINKGLRERKGIFT